jgi:hypothetical protein
VAKVVINPAGQELLDETRTRRDAFLARRLRRLTPAERELLDRAAPLLERLAADDES